MKQLMKVRDKPRVRIDPSLRKKIKILAVNHEVTDNEMLETLVQMGIEALEQKKPRMVAA